MKKAIILQHGGGELANQLWNHISIYAYCVEKNIKCENYSFFEYAYFFAISPINNKILYFLFFSPFHNHISRRNSFRTNFFRTFYKVYILFIRLTKHHSIISSINSDNKPFYLPPTLSEEHFLATEKNNGVLYFEGWLFRNPEGIKKYRDEIVRCFLPRKSIQHLVKSAIAPLRRRFTHIVGIHFRQGDYATFKKGQHFLNASRVCEALKDYLKQNNKRATKTAFVVTSDSNINISDFPGLNIFPARGNAVEDLFTLSTTDIIIGSDSSFGNLAAYFGNIPHIVITKGPIDWAYYQGKTGYFPTKYCTMVHY